jgi:hypothetical protein
MWITSSALWLHKRRKAGNCDLNSLVEYNLKPQHCLLVCVLLLLWRHYITHYIIVLGLSNQVAYGAILGLGGLCTELLV